MPAWVRTVVLKWLAWITFTKSLVTKVDEDAEQKAQKFLELYEPKKNTKPPRKATQTKDGKVMESVSLLAPEWDSTYDLSGADSNEIEKKADYCGAKGEPWSSHRSQTSDKGFQEESATSGVESQSSTIQQSANIQSLVQDSKDCICKSLVEKLESRQKKLLEHVGNMTSMLTDQEISQEKRKEWQLASSILDRSFLVLFIIGLIVSSVAIFMQTPGK